MTALDETPSRPPGRPRGTGKFDEETTAKIVEYVEQGNYLKVAAGACGVSEATLHRWLAAGADAARREAAGEQLDDLDTRYRDFREEVTQAEYRAEALVVASWQAQATGVEGDWRAGRDLVARRAPERWAGVTRVQMTTEETERRIGDAVNEALLALGFPTGDEDDDDLPRETDPDEETP